MELLLILLGVGAVCVGLVFLLKKYWHKLGPYIFAGAFVVGLSVVGTGIIFAVIVVTNSDFRAKLFPQNIVVQQPSGTEQTEAPSAGTDVFVTIDSLPRGERQALLKEYTASMYSVGYSQCVFRLADVCDAEGSELICLCQYDNVWYIIIYQIIDGEFHRLHSFDLSDNACYLTEVDGKCYILQYSQSIDNSAYATVKHSYSYSVFRFDGQGNMVTHSSDQGSYTADEIDGSTMASFFAKLQVFMVKIVVIGDPYMLQGYMWMPDGDAEYGTPPEEPEEPEEQEQYQMGFVNIQHEDSWLNLREGPGVQYAQVLTDPNDPYSIVRQAKGAPVTILETVETGDSENPVWVKVRISYKNQVYIGWSSRRYIKLIDG